MMANRHGSFIWYELLTGETDSAGRFYADLLGWKIGTWDGGVEGYQIFSHDAQGIGGMMRAPGGVRPGWLGYIGVDDVDATVAAITADGGTVKMPAWDLPGVGRIALLADPQGAPFYVMRGASDQPSTANDRDAVGHCAWNELTGRDLDSAVAFYARHFGWRCGDLLPMGEMGGYQLMLPAGEGDIAFCAIMARAGEMPPMWGFYFRVANIEVAGQQLVAKGGMVLHGPQDVPGGDRIIIATDPQGAVFGLVGKTG